MKISKQELIEMDACVDGLDRFIEQTGDTDKSVDVKDLIGGKNDYYDALWLAGKRLPKDKIVRFACDCALINIELIKPYTDDYDLIYNFLVNPTNDTACVVTRTTNIIYDARIGIVNDAIRSIREANITIHAGDAEQAAAAAADAADAAADVIYTGVTGKINNLLVKLFEE